MPPAAPPVSNAQLRKAKRQERLARESQDQEHDTSPRPPSPPPAPAQTRIRVTQFVMNLPDTAILFLGAFRGLLSPANVDGRDLSGLYTEMPMVHCYCFTREAEIEKAAADIRAVRASCVLLCVACTHIFASESSTNWDTLWARRCRTFTSGLWRLRRRCSVSASDSHGKWPSKRSL